MDMREILETQRDTWVSERFRETQREITEATKSQGILLINRVIPFRIVNLQNGSLNIIFD